MSGLRNRCPSSPSSISCLVRKPSGATAGDVCSGRLNTEAPARISKFSRRVVSGSPFAECSTLSTENVMPVAPERHGHSSARAGLALHSAPLCITAVLSPAASFGRKEVSVGLRSLSKRDWKRSSMRHLSICSLTRRATNTTSRGIDFTQSKHYTPSPSAAHSSKVLGNDLTVQVGRSRRSNPQPSPPCSLVTVRASFSSRSPANLECRSWLPYASYCTLWREPSNREPQGLLRIDQAQ